MQKYNEHLVGELLRPLKIEKNLHAKHKVLLGAHKWGNDSSSAVQLGCGTANGHVNPREMSRLLLLWGMKKKPNTKKHSSRGVFAPHFISWMTDRKEATHLACQLALSDI